MSTVPYHLQEQAVAANPADPRYCFPEVGEGDRVLVDIGCGIGQSWLAVGGPGRALIGIDVDEEALAYGHRLRGDQVHFLRADGMRLPLASASTDLVFSRVALPYTNIPAAIREVRRVLRPGGRFWASLHPLPVAVGYLRDAIRHGRPRRAVHATYILANGLSLSLLGQVWPFVNGRYESWQSPAAMKRLLRREGFRVSARTVGQAEVVEGVLER